nr:hypothetical protein [Tanacetum cinerariifolium]
AGHHHGSFSALSTSPATSAGRCDRSAGPWGFSNAFRFDFHGADCHGIQAFHRSTCISQGQHCSGPHGPLDRAAGAES